MFGMEAMCTAKSSLVSSRYDAYLLGLMADDCPQTDLTTFGLGIESAGGSVTAAFKTPGIVAGSALAARLFELSGASVVRFAEDGDRLAAGEPILRASGSAAALHAVYKTAQCVMEYAGGIALRTHLMVCAARAAAPDVHVALTRKHFPGTKPVAYAGLYAGGGIVHRFGLSDSILVFDQHRAFCSDPAAAIRRLMAQCPERKVAVEAASPEEALRFVALGIDIIQCERFSPEALAAFVPEAKRLNSKLVINAAGGISASNAAQYARAGADVLVTSWPYYGAPFDVKMRFETLETVTCGAQSGQGMNA